jgi:hypothetical protein
MGFNKNVYIDCMNTEVVANIAAGSAATGATTTKTHFMHGGISSEQYNTGANTTRIKPVCVVDANCTNGWEIASTDTDNVGGTWAMGGSHALSDANRLCQFTVGTDPAFFFEVKVGIPDVSDYDVFGVGFVEPAASVANINTPAAFLAAYDEKAMIVLRDGAGDIGTYTSLAGSDTNTDLSVTDWADDAVKTLKVLVDASGNVTYTIDGTAASGAVAFAFADTTVVQPVIIFCKGAAVANTPPIVNFIKWGLQ